MANIVFKIEANNIDTIKETAKEAINKAMNEIGLQAQNYISMNCPFETGRLAGSITYATKTERQEVRAPAKSGDAVQGAPPENGVIIGTNVEYAGYLEFGTSRIDAMPYIKPNIEAHMGEFKDTLQKHLQNA